MAKPPKGAPWAPAKYRRADVGAIQALSLGAAEPHQQIRALKWIVEELCKTYDLSFRPGSERDTVFAEGKRHVGLQIVKLTKISTRFMRKHNGRSTAEPDTGTGRDTPGIPAGRTVAGDTPSDTPG